MDLDELSPASYPEWTVFRIDRGSSYKLTLHELAQVRAVDGDRAILLVAEDEPATDGKQLCAIPADLVQGRPKIRLRYLASFEDLD
jgi:CelD/BcsL family acetyltransferase involved in cellulose biosynthesis